MVDPWEVSDCSENLQRVLESLVFPRWRMLLLSWSHHRCLDSFLYLHHCHYLRSNLWGWQILQEPFSIFLLLSSQHRLRSSQLRSLSRWFGISFCQLCAYFLIQSLLVLEEEHFHPYLVFSSLEGWYCRRYDVLWAHRTDQQQQLSIC